MTAQEIRRAYLKFFTDKQHAIIARAQLVPLDDPTTLFTGSGMQPLIPYLLGAKHPSGVRLVDSQTCLRAQDIEDVGDNRHTTFFEMLGNWSLGDYFRNEQISWVWQFLTKEVKLDPKRIYISVFIGDEVNGLPKDQESIDKWQEILEAENLDHKVVELGSAADGGEKGMQDGRIFLYDAKENWWSRVGLPKDMPAGEPGGFDTEMFYLFPGVTHDPAYGKECHPACDCGRFIEIGNSVFMQYVKQDDGSFSELPKKNVDYGGGLERIAAAAIDSPDVFRISVLWPIVEALENLSHKKYDAHTNSMRVIADHLRGAAWLAVDGVTPSNKEQGYVMRRLMRRAIRFAFELGIEQNLCEAVVPVIVDIFKDDYPEVASNQQIVVDVLAREEKIFRQTLRKGIHQFTKLTDNGLSGKEIFTLYDTYGFPMELSVEEAYKQGITVSENWQKDFDVLMDEQRKRSQTATKGIFKGGLGGQTLQHKKYHTATHLMYQALRDVLGDHVIQRGSNITEERLRFDFSHPQKVTPEELAKVEDIVNEQIKKDLKVSFKEYPTKVAREEKGALGQFGDRYGDVVKVYSMQADGADKPFSFEICGGPHVEHTLQLAEDGKVFKIIKEEASSAGIRRIKAKLVAEAGK